MHDRLANPLHFKSLPLFLLAMLMAIPSSSSLCPKLWAQDATATNVATGVAETAQVDEAAQPISPDNGDSPTASTDVNAQATATAGNAEKPPVEFFRPLVAMGLGVFVVLALMIGLKSHAFVALILGALTISCFVPLDVTGFVKSPEPHVVRGDTAEPVRIVSRVAGSLGANVGSIGILIAMAAIIGKCMLVSGAADRIVKTTLQVLGEKRAALAMMVSGFVLAIPVFFDTVFYLLVPLARSLYRRTGKNYLLYLAAIAAGGAITHTLVPPTPGPLLVVEALKVNIGLVMLLGLAVGFPSALVGLGAAYWLNRVMPIEMRPLAGESESAHQEFTVLPSLGAALIPVMLPVILISAETIFSTIVGKSPSNSTIASIQLWLKLFGDPNFAMVVAAMFAIYLCWKVQGHSFSQLSEHVEDALLSGGVIILITAAGGAFGGLLAMTEIQAVVQSFFEGNQSSGLVVMLVAWGLAAIIKVAQGSSTVAMIITSSLVASIALPLAASNSLGFHPAYLVSVIGSGSLMGSWMNDSGFWVFAKMGVLTEGETLRSWTILLCILSVTGFLVTLAMATVLPLT